MRKSIKKFCMFLIAAIFMGRVLINDIAYTRADSLSEGSQPAVETTVDDATGETPATQDVVVNPDELINVDEEDVPEAPAPVTEIIKTYLPTTKKMLHP